MGWSFAGDHLLAHATAADSVEATGATCFVLNPMRFGIITDSWKKTERQHALNMGKRLWVFLGTGEFSIPTVYNPRATIRTLRRLFANYYAFNRQICMLKNTIKTILTKDGGRTRTSDLRVMSNPPEPLLLFPTFSAVFPEETYGNRSATVIPGRIWLWPKDLIVASHSCYRI
ncbi:MAG: hypothetical protein WD492_18245 [Alkalispirochaeta sp.]